MGKKNYKSTVVLIFIIGTSLLVYIINTLGFFTKDKIVITTLATTGPDYDVVFGQLKLKAQLPDTSVNFDVNGIMTTGKGAADLDNYLQQNYLAFGDYFVLTEKTVGLKKSDTDNFHPLIEILSWQHINRIFFWLLVISDLAIFILGAFIYKKGVR